MIAGLSINGGTGVTMTPPSGWTLIRRTDNGTSHSLFSYYRVAGGSEFSSWSWTWTGGSSGGEGLIDDYTGVSNSSPIDTSGGQANASSTNVTAPSITVGASSGMVVGLWAIAFKNSPTIASGFTARATLVTDTGDACGISSGEEVFAAGATGTQTGTSGTAAVNEAQLISLNAVSSDDESEMMESRICM